MSTSSAFIELCVGGHSCEREVTLFYEYERACGDGWNEPRQEAGVTLYEAQVDYLHGSTPVTLDVFPLLSKECIGALESMLLAEHEEARQPDPDMLRDYAREVA